MGKRGYLMKFRRRREGKTDYKKRLALVKSGKPILTVRRTNTQIIAHIREFNPKGDVTKVMVTSKKLAEYGWDITSFKNTPAAYLTGYLIGKMALKEGINEAILDIGRHTSTKGARIFAVLKGAVDAGLNIPHSPDKVPDESRIMGEHISRKVVETFKKVKENIDKVFSAKSGESKKSGKKKKSHDE